MNIVPEIAALDTEMRGWRHRLHAHPETAFEETATSAFVADKLRSFGLDVVGFPSRHVPFQWSKKTRAREIASRFVACLDVYLLHTQPKFNGPPVTIRVAERDVR